MEKAKRNKTSETIRDWGQMDSNILIIIFQKLLISDLLLGVAHVCSEWRKAASHTHYFIEENELDLRFFDTLTYKQMVVYANLLMVALKTETNLFHLKFCELSMLPGPVLLYMAQRSSTSLKSLFLPDAAVVEIYPSLLPMILPYWKNLKSFTVCVGRGACTLKCINLVGLYCKNLSHLGLHGFIDAPEAEKIVASFPELQILDFSACLFKESVLGIILNGAKNLKRIDLTHAFCWMDDMKHKKGIWKTGAMELNEQILDKLKALENFTYCDVETCYRCVYLSYGRAFQ